MSHTTFHDRPYVEPPTIRDARFIGWATFGALVGLGSVAIWALCRAVKEHDPSMMVLTAILLSNCLQAVLLDSRLDRLEQQL